MSTFRNPVGPQSSNVYWRRRLLVLLGVVAVIVIIILIVVRPGSGTPGKASGTASSSNSATPPPSTGAAGTACIAANIKLEAVTDKVSYAAGQLPQISMKITNTGAKDCTLNASPSQQELKITSGSETIWDSKDCQQASATDAPPVTLKAGVAQSTTPISWDRTRSATTTCDSTTRPQVTAGGASYHLGVTIGSITSKDTVQFLLN